MPLCFSTLACPNWTLPQIVGAAAAHGFDGVDFRGIGADIDVTRQSPFDTDAGAALDLFREHNLRIPCFNTSVTLVVTAAERWDMMLDECQRHARLAGEAKTPYLRVFGGALPKGMARAEGLSLAQRHLRQLVKICQPHGCAVLVETHDEWSRSEQVMELARPFDSAEVGVLWDLEHPFRHGEAPAQTAAALRGRVAHVHIKDAVRVEGKSLPRLMGEGELPLDGLLGALGGIGYDGWLCLETEKRWHPTAAPEPEQSLPQFMQFMSKHWRGAAIRHDLHLPPTMDTI